MIPIPTEHVVIAPVRKGICFHVDKPCFTLDPPKNKPHKKDTFRTQYYIQRMKSLSKSAQSPDLNMTLNEIKTGIKTSDRMKFSLLVYLLGVILLFNIYK